MGKQKIKLLVVLSLILVALSVPSLSWAAILYLTPSEGNYFQGETFVEEIRLDTEGENINTVKVDLNYSKDNLEIVDFSDGGSLLTLWVERPLITTNTSTKDHEGLISLIGGVPNGFKGTGLIGKIIFKVRKLTQNGAQKNTKEEARIYPK